MGQLSIRDLDDATAARLKSEARRRGQSLNRYIHLLLRQAPLPAASTKANHLDLDSLAGQWTAAQGKAFEKAVAPFCKVDPSLWR